MVVVTIVAVLAVTFLGLSEARTAAPATPGEGWNRFALPLMAPSEDQVQAHKVTSVPAAERSTCADRVERVLNAKHMTDEIEARLVPLRDWTLSIGDVPVGDRPSGNCFLVRRQLDKEVLQVEEGLGHVVVEVRRADGSRLVGGDADLVTYVATTAREWLAPTMQPRGEVHRIAAQHAPAVATWLTSDVASAEDPTRFTFVTCRACCDGLFLRYEIRGYQKAAKRAFQPPPPYSFEPNEGQ